MKGKEAKHLIERKTSKEMIEQVKPETLMREKREIKVHLQKKATIKLKSLPETEIDQGNNSLNFTSVKQKLLMYMSSIHTFIAFQIYC